MAEINDGESAFPQYHEAMINGQVERLWQDGMTLRDYFAAKAMQEFFSVVGRTADYGLAAKNCYHAADAMLKARAADPGGTR